MMSHLVDIFTHEANNYCFSDCLCTSQTQKKSKIFMIHRWSLLAWCSIQIPVGGQQRSQVTQGKPTDKACLEEYGASEREY